MRRGKYYTVANSALCFKVLSIPYSGVGYKKVKVEWWSLNRKALWGNQYGLPRYMKIMDTETRFKEVV